VSGHPSTRAQLLALSADVQRVLIAELAPDADAVPFLKRAKTSALKSLSLTRLLSLQRLAELCTWLYLYGRDDEALAVGRSMLAFPFNGNFTQYGPVESILALTAWLAPDRGDAALADACGGHMQAVYGLPPDWLANTRSAMDNRLGGWQIEWQKRNVQSAIAEGRAADEIQYRAAQLGELAFLARWGGTQAWPMDRIRREFEEQTAHLRRLKKIDV
jgi:hypothetical protein